MRLVLDRFQTERLMMMRRVVFTVSPVGDYTSDSFFVLRRARDVRY